jgi:hypothetical protein
LLTEKLADREQEAAARYNQWHEAYTNLRTVGAENAKLREVLRNARRYIAVDASNRGYQWAVDLRAEIDTAFAIARDTP